jgi:hypothetical protein
VSSSDRAPVALTALVHPRVDHHHVDHPPRADRRRRRPRRGGVPGLVRRSGRAIRCGRAAASRRGVDRTADARARGPDLQGAVGRIAPSVRLAGDRPGDACEPGRVGARPVAHGDGRQDAGTVAGGGARADRQHRHQDARRASRPGADRADGVQLRADRCCARHEGRCFARSVAAPVC